MTDVLLPLSDSALRRYGDWKEDGYHYGMAPNGQNVAMKRFTWTCPTKSVTGDLDLMLSYFADATVDPKRMNDLGYLAGQERQALDILEAMVLQAVNGIGYLGVPNPVQEVTKDVVQTVGEWVAQRGHPERWADQLAHVITQAMARLNLWHERLRIMEAHVDPEHQAWGLAAAIVPPEPKEEG